MASTAGLLVRPLPVLALSLCVLLAWAPPVSAQVKQCRRDDGTTVYTDRRCTEIGAVERDPGHDRAGSRRTYRGGCARTLQDLLFEMTAAIDAGDANRLASLYHWPGISSRGASAVMARLDAVVQRPLVDIVPVLPATARPGPIGAPVASGSGYQYPSTVAAPASAPAPVALRLLQTLDNGSTPSDTVFDLHHHFGCVWIRGG